MKIETAQMIAYIAKQVKEQWPHISRDERIQTIVYNIDASEPFIVNSVMTRLSLTTLKRDETIILTIDGDLGVYYVQENDEREPIRISLLNKRIVRKVTIEEIEVPSTGHETKAELFSLAKEYDSTITEVTYNESE